MPISLDTSTEEIRKILISSYENKLRNMCTIEDEILSRCISLNKDNCRYLYIHTFPDRFAYGFLPGRDIIFDLKYNVPVMECEILSYNSVCYQGVHRRAFNVMTADGHMHYTVCHYVKEYALAGTLALSGYYNSDKLKTYKRYIELKGE